MPPPVDESDQESAEETPALDNSTTIVNDGHAKENQNKGKVVKNENENENGANVDVDDDGDDDDDDDDEEEEVYLVERILNHGSEYEDGKMRYLVKWKGYESKKDQTWEPEENLEGANDALVEYWASIGGRPGPGENSQKKRGRQSTSAKPESEIKPKKQRQRQSKGARSKDQGFLKQDVNPPPTVGYAEVGDDDWKPPPVKDGSWDPLVQSVDTVVRENSDGELWGYLIWNEQTAAGKYYRSKAKLPAIYKACPQRMLHFYERHLVFTNGEPATGGN